MNILLKMLPHDLPAFMREEILTELVKATADAFNVPAPAHAQLSYGAFLRAYAVFTREQAEGALQGGQDIDYIKNRLYQNARPLGDKLRKWLGVASMAEVMALGQLLYRAIGVEIQGGGEGSITVQRCFFSQFYTAPVCDLISGLDDGIFSGLSAGGRLVFTERITEGKACCRACLHWTCLQMDAGSAK